MFDKQNKKMQFAGSMPRTQQQQLSVKQAGVQMNEKEILLAKQYWDFILDILEYIQMRKMDLPIEDQISALERVILDMKIGYFKEEIKR